MPPGVVIREEPPTSLEAYGRVSIAFEVDRVLDVGERDGRYVLTERRLEVPWRKDYDAIRGEGPTRWAKRFDLASWIVLAARADGRRVGGAVIALDTPGVEMLRGRADLAVLWDLRVAPEHRGRGVGAALFREVCARAAARGCVELEVETQNVNVPACRFYARMGCDLLRVRRDAYPELPGEIEMIWGKRLG